MSFSITNIEKQKQANNKQDKEYKEVNDMINELSSKVNDIKTSDLTVLEKNERLKNIATFTYYFIEKLKNKTFLTKAKNIGKKNPIPKLYRKDGLNNGELDLFLKFGADKRTLGINKNILKGYHAAILKKLIKKEIILEKIIQKFIAKVIVPIEDFLYNKILSKDFRNDKLDKFINDNKENLHFIVCNFIIRRTSDKELFYYNDTSYIVKPDLESLFLKDLSYNIIEVNDAGLEYKPPTPNNYLEFFRMGRSDLDTSYIQKFKEEYNKVFIGDIVVYDKYILNLQMLKNEYSAKQKETNDSDEIKKIFDEFKSIEKELKPTNEDLSGQVINIEVKDKDKDNKEIYEIYKIKSKDDSNKDIILSLRKHQIKRSYTPVKEDIPDWKLEKHKYEGSLQDNFVKIVHLDSKINTFTIAVKGNEKLTRVVNSKINKYDSFSQYEKMNRINQVKTESDECYLCVTFYIKKEAQRKITHMSRDGFEHTMDFLHFVQSVSVDELEKMVEKLKKDNFTIAITSNEEEEVEEEDEQAQA